MTAISDAQQLLADLGQSNKEAYTLHWREAILFPAFSLPSRPLWLAALNSSVSAGSSRNVSSGFWPAAFDARRDEEVFQSLNGNLRWDWFHSRFSKSHHPSRFPWSDAYAKQNDPVANIPDAAKDRYSSEVAEKVRFLSRSSGEFKEGLSYSGAAVEVMDSSSSTRKHVPLSDRFFDASMTAPLLFMGLNVQLGILYGMFCGPLMVLGRAAWYKATNNRTAATLMLNSLRMGRHRSAFQRGDGLQTINPFVRSVVRTYAPKGVHVAVVFSIVYWLDPAKRAWLAITEAADELTRSGAPTAGQALRLVRDAVPDHFYVNSAEAAGFFTGIFYAFRLAAAATTWPRMFGTLAAAGFGGALAGAAHRATVFPWGDEALHHRISDASKRLFQGQSSSITASCIEKDKVSSAMIAPTAVGLVGERETIPANSRVVQIATRVRPPPSDAPRGVFDSVRDFIGLERISTALSGIIG